MSDRLGPLSFGKRDELVFLGREIGEQRNYSDEVAKQIDEEVRAIIDQAYERAIEVLTTHRDRLDRLAEKLVAEETVDQRGVREAVRGPAAEGGPPRPAAADVAPRTDGDARPRRPHRAAEAGVKPEAVAGSAPRSDPGRRTARHRRAQRPAIGRARSMSRRRHPSPAMTSTSPPDADDRSTSIVEAFLERTQDDRLEALPRVRCASRASRAPGARAATCGARPSGSPRDLRAIGLEHVEVSADRRPPDRLRRLAPRRGRADGPRLLPLRRPAGRPARPVGDGAVRAVRRDGRVWARGRGRRQGPGPSCTWAAEAMLADARHACRSTSRSCSRARRSSAPTSLDAWLEANRDRLAADVAVISDTGFFEGNRRRSRSALRGLMYAQIDVTGSPLDLHSGGFGGNVQNPANALATIVAALKGPDGRIRVPGFYDEVVDRSTPSDARRSPPAVRRGGVPRGDRRARSSSSASRASRSSSDAASRPTLDVNGIWGGFTGRGRKTIIPAHAHAKVSCRLVADQDGDRTSSGSATTSLRSPRPA